MSLCLWWRVEVTSKVCTGSRVLWTSPAGAWPSSVSQWGNYNRNVSLLARLSHHWRDLARITLTHHGNKPNGTLKSESWHWTSPMSTESLWGNRVVMGDLNKESQSRCQRLLSWGSRRLSSECAREARRSALVSSLEFPVGRDWWTCFRGRTWPCYFSYQKSPGCQRTIWGWLDARDRHVEERKLGERIPRGKICSTWFCHGFSQGSPLSWGFQGLTLYSLL